MNKKDVFILKKSLGQKGEVFEGYPHRRHRTKKSWIDPLSKSKNKRLQFIKDKESLKEIQGFKGFKN